MIKVQKSDFDISLEIKKITTNNKNIGGVGSFIGIVRDNNDKKLQSMTLEHYPIMTEKMLEKINSEAKTRWKLIDSIIIHRYGKLYPGDQIVLVATFSQHRKDALEACEFLIDWLKTKAPFWKLEATNNGEKWVEEKYSDLKAAKKW